MAAQVTVDAVDEPLDKKIDSATSQPTPGEVRSRKISLTVKNITLRELLINVGAAARVTLELDTEALKQEKLDFDLPYDVSITDVDLETVIREVLTGQKPLFWPYLRIHGNTVVISTEKVRIKQTREALPEWMQAVYDNHQFNVEMDDDHQVIGITSYGILTDEMLSHFPKLTKLRSLALHGAPNISVASCAHLAKLTALEQLSLSLKVSLKPGIGDAILKAVAGLKTLRHLDTNNTGITDEGFQHLDTFGQLTSLILRQEVRLTDEVFESIIKHKGLRTLIIPNWPGTVRGRMQFSIQGTALLADLRDLERLDLTRHDYWPEAIRFPRLKSLTISGAEFDDSLAQAISRSRQLTRLDLSFKRIGDNSFQHFEGQPALQDLNIRCDKVSDAAMWHLQNLPKLKTIRLWTRDLTDDTLGYFSQTKSLTSLSLNWEANMFSQDGLNQLSQLPDLQTLELRIIPYSETIGSGLSFKKDNSGPVSIILPRPYAPLPAREEPLAVDLEALAMTLPKTRIVPTEDELDPRQK